MVHIYVARLFSFHAVVLTRQCKTLAVHILRLLMKSSLTLLVTPSGEGASHLGP